MSCICILLFILGDYPFNHVRVSTLTPENPAHPEIDADTHTHTHTPSYGVLTLQDAVLRTRTHPSLGPEQGISLLHPHIILQTATIPSLPAVPRMVMRINMLLRLDQHIVA